MYILTETNTIPRTNDLEKSLIEYYKKDSYIVNDITQGGGGQGIIYKKNYIYVMLFK